MKKKLIVAGAIAVIAALSWTCSPVYLLRAGYHEAKILARRQPIVDMLRNPDIPAETREKLALVLQARDYAERVLDLDTGDSYTLYSRTDGDTLAIVLSAARKDRFEKVTWWFPIVGHVPYRGYFNPRAAERAAERMERRGYDTYLRPIAAFSTLGWFNDPLLSTLLRHNEVPLVNTVIHELTHNSLYLPGQAAFNESFATFVGGRGAIDFFCELEGADGPRCIEARDAWADDLLFGRFLEELIRELETLYARDDLSLEQRLAQREPVFQDARRRFAEELRPQLRVSSFRGFERGPINNASIISRRIYYDRLELFEAAYENLGGDLPATIRAIQDAAEERRREPFTALAELGTAAGE